MVDSELEVCLEEDEDCLGGADFLDRKESAYEVGRVWFWALLRPWFVGWELD